MFFVPSLWPLEKVVRLICELSGIISHIYLVSILSHESDQSELVSFFQCGVSHIFFKAQVTIVQRT